VKNIDCYLIADIYAPIKKLLFVFQEFEKALTGVAFSVVSKYSTER
jgi:hypothetical protein